MESVSDSLSLCQVVHAGYNTSKLLLFGPFANVFPWLLRRLDENKVPLRLHALSVINTFIPFLILKLLFPLGSIRRDADRKENVHD
jgi:hypothetical protein